MDIFIRPANGKDVEPIIAFVDFWMRGFGVSEGIPGTGNDYFVPRQRHIDYCHKYHVVIAEYEGRIVGWCVTSSKGVLIHLLVAATFRKFGIGQELLRASRPMYVRCKLDQRAGNPIGWYRKRGYVPATGQTVGKKNNIMVLCRK